MSGEASRLIKYFLSAGLRIAPFISLLFLLTPALYADAFLAEDRIYYGADKYSINYEDEIIVATGNAFFKKQQTTVYARKVIIHYSEEVKKAFFYDDVVIVNKEDATEIRGDYGEAYFRDDFYLIEGNASYSDDLRTITSRKIESDQWEKYFYYDDVVYSDANVRINARTLEIDEGNIAHFRSDVAAVFIESGDELYCESLKHFIDTGNSEFQGKVIFIQNERAGEQNSSLVINSEVVKYFRDTDHFLLMDRVYVLNGEYSMRGSIMKYYRNERIVESIGESVVYDRKKIIYCDQLKLDLDSRKIVFIGSVKGVIKIPSE